VDCAAAADVRMAVERVARRARVGGGRERASWEDALKDVAMSGTFVVFDGASWGRCFLQHPPMSHASTSPQSQHPPGVVLWKSTSCPV